ncbi:hypothetical protein [[Clostridium] polysaccharolyticum]|nr:hypothetical protein [[Clostridium] polysaccharolyticum]
MYYLAKNENVSEKEIRDVKEIEGVEGVGYEMMGKGYLALKRKKNPMDILYLNDTMQSIQYKLASGKWFDSTSKKCEVILSGDFSRKYKAGDTIVFYTEKQERKKAAIVGKLQNPSFLMMLDYTGLGNSMTFKDMLVQKRNMILTNNIDLLCENGREYPSLALVVKLKDNNKETISQLHKHGQLIPFGEISENSEIHQKELRKYVFPLFVPQLVIVIFCIICTTLIQVHKSKGILRILRECGASKLKIICIVTTQNTINIACSAIAYVFMIKFLNWKNHEAYRLNMVFSIIFILFMVFTTAFVSILCVKKRFCIFKGEERHADIT